MSGGALFLSSSITNPKPPKTTTTTNSNHHSSKPSKSFSFTTTHFQSNNAPIKLPTTPPWINKNSILHQPKPSNNNNTSIYDDDDGERPENSDRALTDKISGGRGKKAMRKIFQGIEHLRKNTTTNDDDNSSEMEVKKSDEFEFRVSLEEIENRRRFDREVVVPWEKDDKVVFRGTKKEKIAEVEKNDEIEFSCLEKTEDNRSFNRKVVVPWEKDEMVVFRRMEKEKIAEVKKTDEFESSCLEEKIENNRSFNRKVVVPWEKGETLVFRRTKKEKIEKVEKTDEFEFSCLDKIENRRSFHRKIVVPWEKDEKVVFRRTKKEKIVTAAEMRLDKMLLERLRNEAFRMRKWVKVKKAGITQAVVDEIKFIWKRNELAMIKFDLPLCRNMDRAHEIAEIKTGGLVVWSKKDTLVIYRGCNYNFGSRTFVKVYIGGSRGQETESMKLTKSMVENNVTAHQLNLSLVKQDGERESLPNGMFMDEIRYSEPVNGSLYEREADRLLDGLGPRFIDWWRPKPLPVDADLLPEVVPGYKPPFRRPQPNGTSKLTDDELTYLRKLAQPLPFHFVLGRNRKLQGLAAAILKLWEKSYIVKIAIKSGALNTSVEDMAYELKCLTEGVLLLRNKYLIIFYRGKDFLPCGVANIIAQRDIELSVRYLQEENARLKAAETLQLITENDENTSSIGTLSEFQCVQNDFANLKTRNKDTLLHLEVEKERVEKELRNQERKLFILQMKIEKSAKELSKLNSAWSPSEKEADQELVTEEERECLRKIALKMSSSLLLGRRGVFDGVVEGIHQHWKYREVVKVITMQRAFSQIIYTAQLLEAESGGILISIDKLKEGHAIIIYRGKNYRRPLKLATNNLLTKRKALEKSLELQRIGSLKYFAYQRRREISDMEYKLEDIHNKILKVNLELSE